MKSKTKIVQISNIAPQATKDQMSSLFGYLGKIEDIRLYPTIRDVAIPVQSRMCFIKFQDRETVGVAQHLTNTVFIDRALIVVPYMTEMPDEKTAMDILNSNGQIPGLGGDASWPPHVTNYVEGIILRTNDPRLAENGLPEYPNLPATTESYKVNEIRRTVVFDNIAAQVTSEEMLSFAERAGQVKYLRMGTEQDGMKNCLVEYTEQIYIIEALKLNQTEYMGHELKVNHSTVAIIKPQTKSNEAAQKEIEEAMRQVKDAQNSIFNTNIDPIAFLEAATKEKFSLSRSRSRSRSRRKSRSRSRRRSYSKSKRRSHSRSRSRRKHRSRSRKRSKSRKRSRSRSPSRKKSRSRSRKRSPSRHRREKRHTESRRRSSKERKKSSSKSKEEEEKKLDEKRKEEEEEEKSSATPSGEENKEEEKNKDSKENSSKKEKDKKSSHSRRSRSRSRDRSKDRKYRKSRSRSRSRKRSRSRDRRSRRHRTRSRSPPLRSRSRSKREKSRERRRSVDRSRKRSSSRSRRSLRDRSRSKDRKDKRDKKERKKDKKEEKRTESAVTINYDDEEEKLSEKEDKEETVDMDISNSP